MFVESKIYNSCDPTNYDYVNLSLS